MKAFLWAFPILLASGPQAQPVIVSEYSISPSTVDAGQPFALHLLSYSLSCADQYSHQSVRLNGQTITLTFVTTLDSTLACPAVYMPYGPTFTVPALTAGTYTVEAANVPACLFGNPACLLAQPAPQFAGTLTVKDSGAKMWIDPNPIASGTFALSVKSRDFSCNDHFGISSNAEVNNHNLILTFSHYLTDIACPSPDTAVKSVEFLLPTLAAGTYPVLWQPDSTCASSGLACTGDYRSVAFDTLTVTSGSAIEMGEPRGKRLRPPLREYSGSVQGYLLNGRRPKAKAMETP